MNGVFDINGLMRYLHVKNRQELFAYMFDPNHQGEKIVQEFLALLALVKGGEPHEG